MALSRVKIVRCAAGENLARWHDTLASPAFLSASALIKTEPAAATGRGRFPIKGGDGGSAGTGGAWVRRAEVDGRSVYIKCRPISGPGESLKRLLGATRGDRAWRGATWLTMKGFRTARPVVLARAEWRAGPAARPVRVELIVNEAIRGPTLLEVMAERSHLSLRTQHALASAVGRQSVRMTIAGRYNRDHKPSNLIVTALGETEPECEIALIDCVAIQTSIMSGAERMLLSLVLEAIGTGVLPRRALLMRGLAAAVEEALTPRADGDEPAPVDAEARRRLLRRTWRDIARRIERHGDPTPRVDPLAPTVEPQT